MYLNEKAVSECSPHFLFILTPPNSGSTALAQILGTSPVATFLQENAEGQWLIPEMCNGGRWREDTVIKWDNVKSVWLGQFYKALSINNILRVVIEKSPPNMLRVHALHKHFERSSYVVFNRDPYANCSSILHRYYDAGGLSDEERKAVLLLTARKWVWRSQILMRHVVEYDFPCFTYEYFCKSPENSIDKILTICPQLYGINAEASVYVKDYGSQRIISQNERQISLLTDEEVSSVTSVLQDYNTLLKFFNYDLL